MQLPNLKESLREFPDWEVFFFEALKEAFKKGIPILHHNTLLLLGYLAQGLREAVLKLTRQKGLQNNCFPMLAML